MSCHSGPYLRLAPNLLSISDPLLLPEIYHRHVDKTPFYSIGFAGEVAPLLQLQDDREHAAKLKALSPIVSLLHSIEQSAETIIFPSSL